MEDKEIIALYNARREDAISETRHKYGRFCYTIAMNILRLPEDAEECENDTYHTAWRQIPPDQPQKLRAYLGAITRNLSISRYRAQRAAKRFSGVELLLSELEECVPSTDNVEETIAAKELGTLIGKWLAELSGESQAIFVRRYWYGENLTELSDRFGYSKTILSQRLHRLRGSLRRFLEKEGVAV